MEKTFRVDILNSAKTIFSGQVSSLIVPSESGYFGVLADHAPLIANLSPGKITLRDASAKHSTFDFSGKGFIEVLDNKVCVLLNNAAI
ncbi:MAG: ATP synthase F1 subunit epsilon [Candidatus Omnitrophica bacterium]|nr:ATP synthase F1 subunit epsilon [Candidatus Omnitrophota bacterium]